MKLRNAILGLTWLSLAAGCGDDVTSLPLAGSPAALAAEHGDGQAGATGATLADPIEVRVTDASGRPVPALKVTWTVQRGRLQSVNDSTDNDGIARMRWVLPATSGKDTAVAAVDGVGQAVFSADVQPVAGTIIYRYLDAGSYHTCGITTTEELICWGYGADGQLGLGSTAPKLFPTLIPGDLRYRAVSGGRFHSCAITLAYEPYCWGSDRDGRVTGGDSGYQIDTPTEVMPPTLFQVIQAGLVHTCALSLAREIFCWGYNGEGELGRSTPGKVGTGFKSVTVGGLHTCAIAEDGSGSCWGFNDQGQLGDGTTSTRTAPVDVLGGATFATDPVVVPPSPDPDFPLPDGPFIAAGYAHTCALTSGGSARCWGLNEDGQLGDGTTTRRLSPVTVSGGLIFARITAGRQHSCAITSAGAAYCWGSNTFGQLGDGTTTGRTTPRQVSGGLTFAYLKAGDYSTCGVTISGVAYCWGDNEYGQLGDGTTTASLVPKKVSFSP